mmetsp:Transcript_17615/g.44669  ORF Transcript_17615/g.44669 Transcript_17615/m.44669 type:complete len:250 (+) Transcript_17615:264-1013(+)
MVTSTLTSSTSPTTMTSWGPARCRAPSGTAASWVATWITSSSPSTRRSLRRWTRRRAARCAAPSPTRAPLQPRVAGRAEARARPTATSRAAAACRLDPCRRRRTSSRFRCARATHARQVSTSPCPSSLTSTFSTSSPPPTCHTRQCPTVRRAAWARSVESTAGARAGLYTATRSRSSRTCFCREGAAESARSTVPTNPWTARRMLCPRRWGCRFLSGRASRRSGPRPSAAPSRLPTRSDRAAAVALPLP